MDAPVEMGEQTIARRQACNGDSSRRLVVLVLKPENPREVPPAGRINSEWPEVPAYAKAPARSRRSASPERRTR